MIAFIASSGGQFAAFGFSGYERKPGKENGMKKIKVSGNKCTGCHHCEAACSLQHYKNEVNPKKSRVRVYTTDGNADRFFPVLSDSRSPSNIPWFREPGTAASVKCDLCGNPPDPQCVKVCASGALTMLDA